MEIKSYPIAVDPTILQDAGKLGGALWLLLLAISRIGACNGPQFTDSEAAEALGGGISPKLVSQWRDCLVRAGYIAAEQEGEDWRYHVERGRRVFL